MKNFYRTSKQIENFTEASGRVEKLVCGGLGLLRHPDFGVCLVPHVLPNEQIRFLAQPPQRNRSVVWARLIEIVEPAAERITPRCVHYDSCGGCDWQHMSHRAQLQQKAEIVLESLQRLGANRDYRSLQRPVIGGFSKDSDDSGAHSSLAWGYRQRAKFFSEPKDSASDWRLGFRERGSRKLLEVPGCLVVTPEIRKQIRKIGEMGRIEPVQNPNQNKCSLHVFSVDGQCYWEDQEFCYRWRELRVYSQARLFFQSNAFVLPQLLAELRRSFAPILQNWKAPFLDLYAGVGLFSLCFAALLPGSQGSGAFSYFAVERSAQAFVYLQRNLAKTGFVCCQQDVGAFLQQALQQNRRALKGSFIFVDPSRGGLSANVSRYLNACEAAYILVLSCDAASFSRDVGRLDHSYCLKYWQLVDFYPQTHHIEVLALLQRRADT